MPRILACFAHERLFDGMEAVPVAGLDGLAHKGVIADYKDENGALHRFDCATCRWKSETTVVTTAVLGTVGDPTLRDKERDKPATAPKLRQIRQSATPPATNPETENRVLAHFGSEREGTKVTKKPQETKREHRRGTAIERKVGGVPMKLIIQGNILDMEKDARDQVLGFVDSFKALPKE